MDKLSIIIPNYNCEKFIIKCLDSVVNQNYDNTEIIIIDDGSTDNSVEIINKYIDTHKNKDIKLICQNNLNASIARNEGIKAATGRYLLFLDSDDELEEGIIYKCLDIMSKGKYDMIIGNYEIVDENSNLLRNNVISEKDYICKKNNIYDKLVEISPVPSNKIYDMELIKKYSISWGNVRIGQDLNFYLKYLSVCDNIYILNDYMYKYRIVNNSISRTYDFKIFDIVNAFKDVRKYYDKNKKIELYENYIQVLELKNYNSHIWKQAKFKTKKERMLVVDYFAIHESKINYSRCKNYTQRYKKMRLKFRLKTLFKFIYTSRVICNLIINNRT